MVKKKDKGHQDISMNLNCFTFPDNSQESLLFEEEERSTQSIVSVLSSTPSSQNSKFPSNISPLPDAHPSPMYVFEGFLNLNYLLAVKNVHLLQNQFSLWSLMNKHFLPTYDC